MNRKPGNLENLWNDLKRRRVTSVITVYAAIAFAILQVTDIVARPLQLPEWTEALVIVLLSIGFIITVLLSWVYDLTPSGVKRTKTVNPNRHSDQIVSAVSPGWKIATFISIAIILALVAFNLLSHERTGLGKSVAVLPFKMLSDESDKQYLADGMMDAITLHLSKIKDLRVMSRTSVEQYRVTTKTSGIIGRELDVEYLLEGSFQKYGDNVRLILQLIKVNGENNTWANEYNNKWSEIFSLQSEVAQKIASELNAVISPAEKQLIEKIPTPDLIAYDLYFKAKNEHLKFWLDNWNIDNLNEAMTLYRLTLQYDSEFAQAYSGLAWGYLDKHRTQTDMKVNFVDSMIFYADKALNYNDQLDEAFYVRGHYYNITGDYDRALREFGKAIEINPNFSQAYDSRASLHFLKTFDTYSAFNDIFKAIQLEHGPLRSVMLGHTGETIGNFGFPEIARHYFDEAYRLENDSIRYLNRLAGLEEYLNDLKALELYNKVLKIDRSNLRALYRIMNCYERMGRHDDAYKTALNFLQIVEEKNISLRYGWDRIGYAFFKKGHTKEAEDYFNKILNLGEKILELDPNDDEGKLAVAGVYAVLGEREKALQLFKSFNDKANERFKKGTIGSVIYLYWLKYDPLLESLRNESIFQKGVSDYENTYNITHERFKAWLEKNGAHSFR
jgi:TolB-like protein